MFIGNMGHMISFWSGFYPESEAVVYEGNRISYRELNERINKVCHVLTDKLGIVKGDRVGILLNNCVEFYDIVFACSKIGAIFVPLNIRLAGRELEYIVNNSEPKVIITEQFFNEMLEPVKEKLVTGRYLNINTDEYSELMNNSGIDEPENQASWEDDFGILYTSGTTGLPKGAVLTNNNVLTTCLLMNTAYGFTQEVKQLLPLPLCFTGAIITISMPTFHAGGSIILEKEFDPGLAIEIIEKEKITHFYAVPTLLELISQQPEYENSDFSSIKVIGIGAAPVYRSLIKKYELKGISLANGYGLTEGSGYNMYMPGDKIKENLGAYLPGMWNQIKIADDSGNPAKTGEVGEIIIKGSNVLRCYWNMPEATAESIKDGWLYTGDMGRMDENGRIYIVDRKKDMIISGGLNVYPVEVENIISEHPAVEFVAVIGKPDNVWGEAVTAIVVAKPDIEVKEDELIKFCRENLADYKSPKSVIFIDEMPMTVSGKILKPKLRELHGSGSSVVQSD
ncbi:MAG: long-chain fatty acid--CoA ligase [Desulfobacterales bacterium]|nr:long-chain fatty acid--CoA ligase [Desulfobacteraceae bacterium]MBT4363537.1 long-chain fatty acid--CoA ligase [Desulfobacteraceae bacterium]MBT7084762.1 long-chain fatty acid--CoA ligase [Desulfobacterales bacterium]